jgi:hypothetical protein
MDYKRIYNQLIDKAQKRKLITYSERHHILPVSMGGKNNKDNLVDLTSREHLIAHMLLWRIYRNRSMSYALWMMSHRLGIRITSRMYEELRINVSKFTSERMTGKIASDETKARMSKAFTGRVFTAEHKEKISNYRKGKSTIPKGHKFNLTEDEIKQRSESRKGKYTGESNHMKLPEHRERQRILSNSPEFKQRIKEKMTGHKPYNFKKVSACGIEYATATECAKILGVTYNWLMRRIRMDKYPDYFYVT